MRRCYCLTPLFTGCVPISFSLCSLSVCHSLFNSLSDTQTHASSLLFWPSNIWFSHDLLQCNDSSLFMVCILENLLYGEVQLLLRGYSNCSKVMYTLQSFDQLSLSFIKNKESLRYGGNHNYTFTSCDCKQQTWIPNSDSDWLPCHLFWNNLCPLSWFHCIN